jgi:hypothetical protein
MPFEIELRLIALHCEKSGEETDELYCQVAGKMADGAKLEPRKLPHNSTWKLASGQSAGPNLALWAGEVGPGLELEIKFYEEDAAGIIAIADDHLGGFSLAIHPDQTFTFAALKRTEDAGRVEHTQRYRFTGGNAVYIAELGLFQQSSLL